MRRPMMASPPTAPPTPPAMAPTLLDLPLDVVAVLLLPLLFWDVERVGVAALALFPVIAVAEEVVEVDTSDASS